MERTLAGGNEPPPKACDAANPADTTASPNDAWNEMQQHVRFKMKNEEGTKQR
jgi:hypothetical protein